jgi:hypothetical protein
MIDGARGSGLKVINFDVSGLTPTARTLCSIFHATLFRGSNCHHTLFETSFAHTHFWEGCSQSAVQRKIG